MTISDYYDIEILASREGITPSRYMAREEERKARFTKYNHTQKGAERLKRYAICSICDARVARYDKYSYCPSCGCRMVEPQERSDKK